MVVKVKANFLMVVLMLLFVVSVNAQEISWKQLTIKVVALCEQKQYLKATKIAEEALEIAETTFGSMHSNTATSLENLAIVYHSQGRYAEAELLYKRAMVVKEKVFGSDHLKVAICMESLQGFTAIKGDMIRPNSFLHGH